MIDIELARSPYDTLQEQQIGQPYGVWRILVVCQLLNRTHGRQVRPMIDGFFVKWPTPGHLLLADPQELKAVLRPLGFAEQRFRNLRTMSKEYQDLLWADRQFWKSYEDGSWCTKLAGCGQYAKASLDVVVYGRLMENTGDTWLEKYRLWRLEIKDLRSRGMM